MWSGCPHQGATSVLIWEYPLAKRNTANGVNHFPLLNVAIILTLGRLTSFPRNPIWAKTLSDIQVKETFYSTFTQSDSLQMEVLE